MHRHAYSAFCETTHNEFRSLSHYTIWNQTPTRISYSVFTRYTAWCSMFLILFVWANISERPRLATQYIRAYTQNGKRTANTRNAHSSDTPTVRRVCTTIHTSISCEVSCIPWKTNSNPGKTTKTSSVNTYVYIFVQQLNF